jgi:hypothetical protein
MRKTPREVGIELPKRARRADMSAHFGLGLAAQNHQEKDANRSTVAINVAYLPFLPENSVVKPLWYPSNLLKSPEIRH